MKYYQRALDEKWPLFPENPLPYAISFIVFKIFHSPNCLSSVAQLIGIRNDEMTKMNDISERVKQYAVLRLTNKYSLTLGSRLPDAAGNKRYLHATAKSSSG